MNTTATGPADRAYAAGWEAFQDFRGRATNPHPEASEAHSAWALGWDDAQDDAEKLSLRIDGPSDDPDHPDFWSGKEFEGLLTPEEIAEWRAAVAAIPRPRCIND
jgi:ribosome modulation factor